MGRRKVNRWRLVHRSVGKLCSLNSFPLPIEASDVTMVNVFIRLDTRILFHPRVDVRKSRITRDLYHTSQPQQLYAMSIITTGELCHYRTLDRLRGSVKGYP
jgi:hypothetical protein